MMNRLLTTTVLSVLLVSAAQAEPIKVRIQTSDKKVHIGTLMERVPGAVIFQPTGDVPAQKVADGLIAYIQFPVEEENEEAIKRLFDEGKYHELAKPLNELLPPCMPYISLPSNLTYKFLRWMVVSYWTGNYDRVLELANAMQGFNNEEFKRDARFYRGLAELAKGNFQAVEKLMNGDDVDTVYPPQSAARLYIEARLLQHQQKPVEAIRTAARLMALHSRDADWMPLAELLCAETYVQLDMPESAKAAIGDIKEFYSDPQIQKKADAIAAEIGK